MLQDLKTELREYIECPEKLPIHRVEYVQQYWPREENIPSLLSHDLAPLGTALKFNRDPITGQITDMQEIVIQGAGETSRNSMMMRRAPCKTSDDSEIKGALVYLLYQFTQNDVLCWQINT